MGASPQRTCVGCRALREQRGLIRLHADAVGRLTVSRPGAKGRSAYLCPSADCLARALERKAFSRALRRAVDTADVDGLRTRIVCEIVRRAPRAAGRDRRTV